jgi:hypothetical protein
VLLAPPLQADEGRFLAEEMMTAYREVLKGYQALHPDKVLPEPADTDKTRNGQPDQVSWFDLERLARVDPALARTRWQEIKQAASDELRSGHRAARALEIEGDALWQRARFLALRDALHEQFQPRDPSEAMLIDHLAQYETMRLQWVEVLNLRERRMGVPARQPVDESKHYLSPPCVSDVKAVDHAMMMVVRLGRLIAMTHRSLYLMRRKPALYVGRARQVNLGERQINIEGR